nr:hypothetical protein BaRGS_009574 [Batillaria attramentaria]
MSDVKLGEHVLSADDEGQLVYSEVIAFLDRDSDMSGYFYTITTDNGQAITLTAKHLIYVTDSNVTSSHDVTGTNDVGQTKNVDFTRYKTLFAEEVQVGQVILVVNADQPLSSFKTDLSAQGALTSVSPARVTHVRAGVQAGVYAPLTTTGRIVVDGVVTSCYAFINNQPVAHAVFAPMRGWHELSARLPWLSFLSGDVDSIPQKGVHIYAKVLYEFASLVLSRNVLYVP